MFEFVVRHLGFLRNVPLFPQLFDGLLIVHSFVFHRAILNVTDRIYEEILTWPGTRCWFHKYGGFQFNYLKKELGHIHGNGLIDIHFDKKTAAILIEEAKALPHHTIKNTGWVSFYIKKETDYENAIELFRTVYELRESQISS